MTVAIVDYGMGNLYSLERALERLGAVHFRAEAPDEIADADRLVLPGVGSAGPAMAKLRAAGWPDFLARWALDGKPLLGICLGFQLLFDASEENGGVECLGLLPGEVVRFKGGMKVPHMGWNDCVPAPRAKLFRAIGTADFYFVHSYRAEAALEEEVAAISDHGGPFCAAVEASDSKVCGVQFHPEKSGATGAALLRNFLAMEPA